MPPSITPIILTATACPAKESPVSTFTDMLNDQLAHEFDNAPPAAGGAL